MSRVYKTAGAFLAVTLFGYFVYYARNAFDLSVLEKLASPKVLLAMFLAAALYSLIILLSAWAWRCLLANAAGTWSSAQLAGIMGSTQIAKYLPGNVAQHLSRTALSLAKGMRFDEFLVSVTIETALALLSALLVGIVCLLATPVGIAALPARMAGSILGLIAIVAMLPALPRFVGWIAKTLGTRHQLDAYQWRRAIPDRRAQVKAFTAYAANYLLIGFGFLLIARALGIGIEFGYAHLTAAFALSWVAGFLAPGMPAGLGVREGVMALILTGAPGSSEILSAIIAMRISTMAGDAAWFFLGGFLLTRSRSGARQ